MTRLLAESISTTIERLIKTVRDEGSFSTLILQSCTARKLKSLYRPLNGTSIVFPVISCSNSHGKFDSLRSQIVTSKGRGGRRHLPYAFTEHGVIMAANVLNSERAVQVSVHVVRAFVQLRQMQLTSSDLRDKLDALEV
jgi:hypothetical protein